MRRLAAILVAVLLGPAAVGAQPLPASRDVLPGGAVLLVAERPAIPIVAVTVRLPAGAAFDPPDAPGLANLTAALLTRGTRHRSATALDEAIEFVGGRLEAEAGRDGALVSLSVLRKDLALGLDLLFEVLTEPAFPPAELARTAREIQAAIRRSEESPESVAARELAELLYPGHPYGHPVPGTVESVGRLGREEVLAFYRRHYRPDEAVIVAAGDVGREAIRGEILRRLTSWAAPPAPLPRPPLAPAAPPARSRRLTRDLTQTTVLLGRPAVGHGHPDYYPLVVASYLLGGGSSSRLYQRVREERGLAYDVGSYLAVGQYGATMMVSLQTRTDGVAEALALTRQEMARMGREPVAEAELGRARAYLLGSFLLRMDTTAKMVRLLQSVEELGLGLDYPLRYRRAIEGVTAADVQRVGGRYLDPAGFSAVIVGTHPGAR